MPSRAHAISGLTATLLALAGCGYDFDRERQRALYEVQQGQYREADARLNELYDCHQAGEPKKPGKDGEKDEGINEKDRLLWRMERGMVSTVAGELPVAGTQLDDAARLVDDRRTESLAREVGTFLLNDNLREYSGHPFEHTQVDYYRLLDHLVEAERATGLLGGSEPPSRADADDHYEKALVRARRMTLEQIQETADAAGGKRYRDDPFARFLAGAAVWSLPPGGRGDTDQQFAQVMFKRSLDAYVDEEKALGHDSHFRWEVGHRPHLVERLALRHALAYDPGTFDDVAKHYGLQADRGVALPQGDGMLLVLDHVGYIARPQVLSIGLGVAAPKLSDGETACSFRIGGLGFWAKGPGADVASAWVVPIPADVMRHLAPGGLAVFGMQMPVHADDKPIPPPARMVARPVGAPASSDARPAGPYECALVVVSDLDAYARSTLKDEQPVLLAKSITRAVTKQVVAAQAAIQAKKAAGGGTQGDVVGAVVNLFGSAAATISETADTRAWTTLPDHVEGALVDLPAGSYSLEVQTAYGAVPLGTVTIPVGQLVVVPVRTFPERMPEPSK
jgi:hypothetical protein